MKRGALFITALLIYHFAAAQVAETSLLESLTEILVENTDEELDVEELMANWEFFLENRININSDCEDRLRQLRFLTEFQIISIVEFKSKNSSVLSIYELAAIDGVGPDLLRKLEPFLVFEESEVGPVVHWKARRELILRSQRIAERAKGYFSENGYAGSPEKYYLRFKQTGDRLNFGVTAEKDPGETFFRKPNSTGFDYTSIFANYDFKKGKYRVFLGDYHVRVGQGLLVWQGFGSGKSAEVSQILKSNQGIRSYASTDENRFFRGAAGTFKFRNSSLFVFHSEKKIDANLDEQNGNTVFTSFQTSGLHRTTGEIDDKHSLNENVSGLGFSFQKNNFSFGCSGMHAFFDKPKVSDGQAYKLFLFQGKQITNVGADYRWALKKIFLFGETAYSFDGGFANLHGVLLKPADQFELSLLYRNFGKRYNSIYGQAFSESSAINDEQGFYVGMKFLPVAKVSVSAYHDFYRYQWLKFKTVSPSAGTETFFQLNYAPSSTVNFYVRYFFEQKEIKDSDAPIKFNRTSSLQKIRLNLDVELDEQWSMKSRAEFSTFSDAEKERGMLLLQDLKYKASRLPFSCQLRLAWFDTEGYNSRLYAYENDLLQNYSVPALSGKGVRMYLNGKLSLSGKIDLWFKLARTQYFDQQFVGTGMEEIESDRKTEMKLQVRYRF